MNKKHIPYPVSTKVNGGRRRLLTTLAWSGSAMIALPERWTKPVIQSVMLPAHAQTSATEEEPQSEPQTISVSCSGTYEGTIPGGTPNPCFGTAPVSITVGPAPGRTLDATAGVYSGTGTYNPDGSFGPITLTPTVGSVFVVIEGNVAEDCSEITGQTLAIDSTACSDTIPNGIFTLTPV